MHKRLAASAAVLALAIPLGTAVAGSGTDRATGGGQVLVSDKGAGSTIAFTAQGTAQAARGQIQYVDRSAGTGRSQVVKHGTVQCIDATGNRAKLAGTWNDGGTFELIVVDNGEGALAESDLITLQPNDTTPGCGEDDDDDDNDPVALARGNAQVYDAG